MLKTVRQSANRKTGPIAVTYRAGSGDMFNTCPASCPLNPRPEAGSGEIDAEYLEALRRAVPRGGQAFTYSHFPAELLPIPAKGETVINHSADTIEGAIDATEKGRAAVLTVAKGATWPARVGDVRLVRCPAEVSDRITCATCGNGRPLCARGPDRRYVVVFEAHGQQAGRVGTDQKGGCYGVGGPVAMQWRNTQKGGATDDAAALERFARELPAGSLLRHHVVGDLGRPA